MKKVAYYITAHGYGHGTRSCDIINAISETDPDVSIIVKTDLPPTFLQSRLPNTVRMVPGAFDVGLIQKDSIRVDMAASFTAVEQFYQQTEKLVEQERAFIRKEGIDAVVADIPAIPLMAAKLNGTPGIAVGNFGWDWIYSDFIPQNPEWKTYAGLFRKAYEQTDLLLRLPFAEPMTAFPNRIDVPLLAKPGTSSREGIAQASPADLRKKWVLLSFTTLELDAAALARITALDDYEFFSVDPLEWKGTRIHRIDRAFVSFADILASVDIVITKPGFGIVSDCIANNKPILYADRENFLEYPILVEAIERYCHNAFISATELYSGNLEDALKAITDAPQPSETMPAGGGAIAAHAILEYLKNGCGRDR